MKKGGTHWRKGLENNDFFLSQIIETLDDHLTNKILRYCTFIHVEKLLKHVLKELTENFPKLIQVIRYGDFVYDYQSQYQFWRSL